MYLVATRRSYGPGPAAGHAAFATPFTTALGSACPVRGSADDHVASRSTDSRQLGGSGAGGPERRTGHRLQGGIAALACAGAMTFGPCMPGLSALGARPWRHAP